MTRRDFLSHGLIPFYAWAVGPSLISLLSRSEALAQGGNCLAGNSGFIPFITVNLSGGPSLAGQFAMKTKDGDYLRSYSRLGLGSGVGTSFAATVDVGGVEFAGDLNPAAAPISKFLVGLRDPGGNNVNSVVRDNLALDKTSMLVVPSQSGDDTDQNQLDVTGLVLRMGLSGTRLPNLGSSDSATGISQRPVMAPPPAPFVVNNVNDLVSALGYTEKVSGLGRQQRNSLAKLISNLTSSQVRKLASTPGNSATTELLTCVGVRNAELIKSGGGDMNPFIEGNPDRARMNQIWAGGQQLFGSMVYNALKGYAATVNINLGGYDYHDGTRTTGDTRDMQAGALVGRILETAEHLKQRCFIYVCADGSTVSTDSAQAGTEWLSDRGVAGTLYAFLYDPTKRPSLDTKERSPVWQIGGFNQSQAADSDFPTGGNPIAGASGIFANYAAWNDQLQFLEKNRIFGDNATRSRVIRITDRIKKG